MNEEDNLRQAIMLRDLLASQQARIVLAESCTAGRVAATLGAIPGISQWLCGSFVIYRNDSKTQWLGIEKQLLDDPHIGPVSSEVTRSLAEAILQRTPEAQYGVAVTGDIGPDAPDSTDGVCFCAVTDRQSGKCSATVFQLQSPAPLSSRDVAGRVQRLNEATGLVLGYALRMVQQSAGR